MVKIDKQDNNVQAFQTSNTNRILYPSDSNGRFCGTAKKGYYDLTSKPYVLFFDLTKCISWSTFLSGCSTRQVCVSTCPAKYFSYIELQANFGQSWQSAMKDIVCADEEMKQQITSFETLRAYVQNGYCTSYTVSSLPWLGRCIPKIFIDGANTLNKVQATNGSLDNMISSLGNANGQIPTDTQLANSSTIINDMDSAKGIIGKIIADVSMCYWQILLILGVSAVLSLLYIVFLRIVGGLILWATIFTIFIITLGASLYCWFQYKLLVDAGAINDYSFHPSISIYFKMPMTWIVLAVAATIVFVLFTILLIVIRSRIKLALKLIEETSQAIGNITSTILFPLFPFALHIAVFSVWAIICLWIASSGVENCRMETFANISNIGNGPICNCADVGSTQFPECKFINVTRNEQLTGGFQAYNLFMFFWMTCFVSSFQDIILAGAFASYYWAFNKKKDVPMFPVLKSMRRAIRFHLGSLATGSLIIAIVKFIKAILDWLHARLFGAQNIILRIIFKCLSIFFWLLETFLKFLNRNAFIMMSISGKPFFTCAKDAFSLLARNLIRVVVVNRVTSLLIFLGKMIVTIGIGFISYKLFTNQWEVEGFNKITLNYYFTPIVIIVIGTYIVSSLFFDVYEIGVNTLFMCFLQDSEINDGSESKPYYMSQNLRKILGKSESN
uniref:Choline transporter-like protein n=1 Tax=Rhabditophanes sp. KR3021 TaxID=114890 RepID=A0AC35UF86_9BILA